MNKEELRKRMSKVIGTYENEMVRRISEDCADIAIQYFKEQLCGCGKNLKFLLIEPSHEKHN